MSASGVWLGSEKGVSRLGRGLLIWLLCPLSAGFWAVKAGGVDLVLRALGGGGGRWGVWRGCGRVLKSAADGRRCRYYLPAACCLLPAACCLTYDFC
jgi:hypothetical protein